MKGTCYASALLILLLCRPFSACLNLGASLQVSKWNRSTIFPMNLKTLSTPFSLAMDPAVTLPPSAAESDGKGRTSPHGSFIRTPGMASTDRTYLSNLSMETATPPLPVIYLDGNKGVTDSLVVIGSALGVLVCLFLAALAVQLKRSVSNPPALKPAGLSVPVDTVQGEEDPEPVYDECGEMTVYSTIGLPMENSEGLYSTVQFSDLPPGADETGLYW